MIIITTQVRENYGTSEAPFWKCKGGHDYLLTKSDGSLTLDQVKELISRRNDMFEEYVIDVGDAEEGFVPEFELSQLEYEGYIGHFEPRLTVRDGCLIEWKKIVGWSDRKDYIWAYNLSDGGKCVWKNDNAKTQP